MPAIGSITTWSTGNTLTAAALNTNFSTIRTAVNTYGLFTDVAATITAVHTHSGTPVFSAGMTITGSITMATAASKIVPGATSFSIRNNADAANNILVTDAGAVTFRGAVTGITSLTIGGALSGVTTLSLDDMTLGTTGKLISGSTSLSMRNNADSVTWLSYTDATQAVVIGASTKAVTIGEGAAATVNIASAANSTVALGYAGGGGTTIAGNTVTISVANGQTVALTPNALSDTTVGLTGIATTATAGFFRFPTCAGTPTGVPTTGTGCAIYDSTGNKLWVYDGGWIGVALT